VNTHLRFILIIITLSTSLLKAQTNLVPNGSFENYSTCPDNNGEFTVLNWFSASLGSPDYFNTCSQNNVGVPTNNFGNQYAYSGNGYSGIIIHYESYNFREYMGSQLITPMESNKLYCVSMHTSLAEVSGYSINNFSALFINSYQLYNTSYCVQESPQLIFSDQIIDTIKWVKLNTCYRATGGETYIILGNFYESDYNKIHIKDNHDECYIYIDDVSVTEIAEPTIKGGTYVCNGDSVTLTADGDISEYTWYDQNSPNTILGNTATLNVSPYQTTTYTLKAKVCGTEIEKNVTVTVCNNGQPSANIYPNPTTDVLNIQLQNVNLDNTVASLYNALGQLVLKENITNYTHTFNTQSLASGLYTLDITTNNKSISKHKVVVLH
jgi:hypothetical protein